MEEKAHNIKPRNTLGSLRIKALTKSEIADCYGYSLREFNREIEVIKEEIGWEKGSRRKILPRYFERIYMHFYGTSDDFVAFYLGYTQEKTI